MFRVYQEYVSLTVVQIEAAVHNPEAFAAFGHL